MPKQPEVEKWLAAYDNPMKEVVLAIRDAILATDPRVDECIKWQAPTFTFNGNIASFYPKSKQHASLMFHQGASIPGEHPLLQGTGGTARMIKLASVAEAKKAKPQIQAVIRAWITLKEESGTPRNAPAARKATPKRPGARASRRTPAKARKRK